MSDKINAIILAGTHADKSKLIYGKNKAFLEINNQPIILNVLNALQNSKYTNKIAVVGPQEQLKGIIKYTDVIEQSNAPKESRRFIENAIRGYNYLSKNLEKTIFIASDLPFISSKTIDDFILQCSDNSAFYFGIINTKNIPEEIEPFKKSARFHLKGKGYYRTANIIVADYSKIKDREFLEAEIEKAFPIRRTTSLYAKARLYWFLAKRYPIEILKYLASNLKERDVEKAFKRELNLDLKFIETKDPRAVIDVDYQEEYDFIKKNYDKINSCLESYPKP